VTGLIQNITGSFTLTIQLYFVPQMITWSSIIIIK